MPLTMTGWNETSFYDPIIGEDSIVVTGFTGQGAYWMRVAKSPPGKSRRAQRDGLLKSLQVAIERGDPPGEVQDDGNEHSELALDRGGSGKGSDEGWSPGEA